MLADSHGFSGFSTNDIGAATRFYGETLGLGNILSVLEDPAAS
jgi:hypothetical protein